MSDQLKPDPRALYKHTPSCRVTGKQEGGKQSQVGTGEVEALLKQKEALGLDRPDHLPAFVHSAEVRMQNFG